MGTKEATQDIMMSINESIELIGNIELTELPAIISDQVREIADLSDKVDVAFQNAKKAKEAAKLAEGKSAGLFHKKEAIYALQESGTRSAEAIGNVADALVVSFKHEEQLAKISKFLIALAAYSAEHNRMVVAQLRGAMENKGSGKTLNNEAKERLRQVIRQLEVQGETIRRQDEIEKEIAEHKGLLEEKEAQDEAQDVKIAQNTARLSDHGKLLDEYQQKSVSQGKDIRELQKQDRQHDTLIAQGIEKDAEQDRILSQIAKGDEAQDALIADNKIKNEEQDIRLSELKEADRVQDDLIAQGIEKDEEQDLALSQMAEVDKEQDILLAEIMRKNEEQQQRIEDLERICEEQGDLLEKYSSEITMLDKRMSEYEKLLNETMEADILRDRQISAANQLIEEHTETICGLNVFSEIYTQKSAQHAEKINDLSGMLNTQDRLINTIRDKIAAMGLVLATKGSRKFQIAAMAVAAAALVAAIISMFV